MMYETRVQAIRCQGRRVKEVKLDNGKSMQADFFVSALPVEWLTPLLDDLLSKDESFEGVCELAGVTSHGRGRKVQLENTPFAVDGSRYLRWMSGIQFFLRERRDMNAGHQMLLDTPWGLTSISQRQFWEKPFTEELDHHGVGTLLSVDISSLDAPGMGTKKKAVECGNEEIAAETWLQLQAALPGQRLPRFDQVMGWFLDDSISASSPRTARRGNGVGKYRVSREPVVVNSSGARELRPGARTRIENFFLAGDYVRTDTDLACMESANESGRRAVNALLDAAGVQATECKISKPEDPV